MKITDRLSCKIDIVFKIIVELIFTHGSDILGWILIQKEYKINYAVVS
jgi:hypothetical protein